MNVKSSFSIVGILVLISTFVELAYQTSRINFNGIHLSPAIWLAGGLCCCFFAGWQLQQSEKRTNNVKADRTFFVLKGMFPRVWMSHLFYWIVFTSAAWFIGSKLGAIFERYPIDPMISDVIPSMQLYVKRFLAGEAVYTQMYFPSWSFFPTYLPFMWAPYIPAEIMQIDYRWTAYAFFVLVLVFWNLRLLSRPVYFEEALFKMLIPFGMLYYFIHYTDHVLGHAIELTPVAYYLILALSLGSKRVWILAVPVVFCLLSRYAFSFWMPVYILILWGEYGFKKAFQVGFLVVTGLGLFYILPFVAQDWSMLGKAAEAYNGAILGQWKTQPWQPAGALPHHLSQGLSFSIYFYEGLPDMEVPERLRIAKIVHLGASLGAALLVLVSYFIMKKKWGHYNFKLFLLISLKFYLIIFYSLLYMPFSYLYQLPLFLSIPIIYETVIFKTDVVK